MHASARGSHTKSAPHRTAGIGGKGAVVVGDAVGEKRGLLEGKALKEGEEVAALMVGGEEAYEETEGVCVAPEHRNQRASHTKGGEHAGKPVTTVQRGPGAACGQKAFKEAFPQRSGKVTPVAVEKVKAASEAQRAVEATLQESAALSHREPETQRGGGGALTKNVIQNKSTQRSIFGEVHGK